ncbi:Alpha-factor-transporting ATPase [Tolypocladium paradoxum]|uniref:Alpha-factor-transporting ATPase n=1 Tax=Tolypocladium paradoxum TaxID=94208 RepID=A0A2S4KUF2_9HYPO|nr:Alpha-factor-transporting ATPase [Tolypocladium paradoxum]
MNSGSGATTAAPSSIEAASVVHLGSTALHADARHRHHQAKASWTSLFAFTKRSHAGVLFAAVVASAATAALRTVLAVFLGRIFDVIAEFGNGTRTGDSALEDVSKWCLVVVGLGLGNWLANTAFLSLWITFGELQADGVRRDIFSSLLARDLAWFDSLDQGISGLLVRSQTQTRELQLATSQVFGFLVCDTATSLASLAMALYYSWKMTLVLLATLPVSLIALSLATRRLEPAIRGQQAYLETTSKLTTASITAIDLVKVFNGLDNELRQYCHAAKLAARHYMVQAQCNSIQMGYIAFWVISMFVVGFWYGIVLVKDGLPPGHVLTTFYATLAALQGIEALVPHWLVLSKGMFAGSFLSSIARSEPPITGSGIHGAARPQNCLGDVRLTNVSFAYPSNPTKKVLNTSSFSFPAGQTTFVVGKSGSGKSTVANLVANLYKPLTGEIQLDGHPFDALDGKWIREKISLIQQTSVLFNDTFSNNVAIGHATPEKATPEEVLEACQVALLQSTLANLPNGLDTHVGAGGHGLSGGQRQKIALARARLRNPTVLILDEIASGLDRVSRALAMDAIREWRKDKTTIIITHDTSNIGDGEYVYVMDNGIVVQEGFGRDLASLLDGTVTALANSPSMESVECPVDSNGDSPDNATDCSTSPDTDACILPSRSVFVSQAIFDELESNAVRHSRSGLPQRTSLGLGTAYAWRLRAEEMWERRVSADRPIAGTRMTKYLEGEKRRFSAFIDSQFSSPGWLETEDKGIEVDLPPPILEESDAPEPGGPRTPTDGNVSFIFGAAERRENIPGLRLASTRDGLEAVEHTSTLSPVKKPAGKPSLLSTLKTVWPVLGPLDRLTLILGLATCLVGAASTPTFAYCLAQLLGVMWSSGDKVAEGRKWALYLVGVAIVDGLCTGGGRYLLERVGQAWVDNIRVEALRRILQQPRPWFDNKSHSPGRISECLERNAEEMRNIVGRFIPIVASVFGIISISVLWALAVSWKLTLVTLAPLPVVMGAIKGYAAVSGKWEGRCNEGAQDSSAVATEIFLNIRVVRALTLEKRFERKYRESTQQTFGLGVRRAGYTSWLYGLYQSMSYGLTALVFYYGMVLLAGDRRINVTDVLQVVNLLLFSIGTSSDILSGIPQLTMAQATAAQLLGYANLPLEHHDHQGRWSRMLHSPLPVRMYDVMFSYPQRAGDVVLRGVSLDIAPGECTAIVGHSGCGKSTLVSLLLGLYTPSNPADPEARAPLTFSNASPCDVDMHHLRSMMAYVSQSPFLFPATIAENIAYGLAPDSPHRHAESIVLAAQAAGLHDFIASLPQGYDTIVGDGGQTLSGGQAQRLSIARALVRRPRLLLLDEPTSALDAGNAATIRQTIRELVQRSRLENSAMAVVLVTHCSEMMQVADKIVVLGHGVKVEEGSYRELAQARGPFRQLISGGEWTDGPDGSDAMSTHT